MKNQSTRKPFFTIVIPTLNEEKYLPLLLECLAKQTNNAFEVIHVDGSSEDKTVAAARKFAGKIDISSHVVKIRNVSYQRNFGASKAHGEWVVFMDADNTIPPYFLDGLKYQIAKRRKLDVFTTWLELENNSQLHKAIERAINFSIELYKAIGKDVALGAMIGARKEIFDKIKFDDKQKVYEDTIFIQDAIKKGYSFDVFRDPRYNTSLRRLEKEGKMKMILTMTLMNLRYLQGKDFSETDAGYVMQGGSYYDTEGVSPLENLQGYLKNKSRKQLAQARKIWNTIKSELELE